MYTVGLIIFYLSGGGVCFRGEGRDHKITTQRASTPVTGNADGT